MTVHGDDRGQGHRRRPTAHDGTCCAQRRRSRRPEVSPAGAAEDDGYAIAHAHDPDRGAPHPVILAAQDFGGEPVARIHPPGRVDPGFHGSWIPDA
ncbi:carotenoid oxygenase family protein [Streptomyces caelestis]|uniref:carotenoid oxygenase family protein n=1 Tax=Streptomyces caelestis TaxID=36816 RepID=UPI0036975D30